MSAPESLADNSDTPPMHQWATDLFPLHRHLTGQGVRDTLAYLQRLLPGMEIDSVASGTRAFGWTVPQEWELREAWIADADGNRIVDVRDHNLHIVQYSQGFDDWVTNDELQEHLHSLPGQPDAIPYVTSYYAPRWGFCVSDRQRARMRDECYQVRIDARHFDGVLNYGELIIPGEDAHEVLLSSYVCHPSMANNELSGPVVLAALGQWLMSAPRRYTYRLLFLPETIGSLVYLSRHLEDLKANVIAGYVLSCCGDAGAVSFIAPRASGTLTERAAWAATRRPSLDYLMRGSDERQYNAPGIDLPVGVFMRSHWEVFPEYHTSLDDLRFISQEALAGTLGAVKRCLSIIEANRVYEPRLLGEPFLSAYGLYPTVSTKGSIDEVRAMLDMLAYADGETDLIEIARAIEIDVLECAKVAEMLKEKDLLDAA